MRRLLVLLMALLLCATAAVPSYAKDPAPGKGGQGMGAQKPMTNKQRQDAAVRVAKSRAAAGGATAAAIPGTNTVMLGATAATGAIPTGNPANTPLGMPDYFGNVPNYANSPLPTSVSIQGDGSGAIYTATVNPDGTIGGFNLVSAGTGYTFADVVVIGGGGSGATGTATIDSTGAITAIAVAAPGSGYGSVDGIKKFTDALPVLAVQPGCLDASGNSVANDLGQCLPLAQADTTSFPATGKAPAADYYEIAIVQYEQQMSASLPPTTLRGYVQISTANVPGLHLPLTYPDGSFVYDNAGNQVFTVDNPQYLGPVIVAQEDHPVRVKFDNYLPKGTGGNLFLPVDSTLMGAGMGPNGGAYSSNRATLHLHGGVTPWISDGTPDQWTTPASVTEQYPKGVSTGYVPDMWYDANGNDVSTCDGQTTCGVTGATTNPGNGSMTFYYTNQQSARLMFYHDHALGITRLNVYSGQAAGYVVQDNTEQALVNAGTIPAKQIPLVIEDKTFVPPTPQLAAEDPTWDPIMYGGYGNLWFPHVYMTNQNPGDVSGANAMGRWDYGQWFWPIFQTQVPETPNPLCGTPGVQSTCPPGENAFNPGVPNPSIVPESFMDTMTVNGTAYPTLTVGKESVRFRILNASNDRTLNLSLYHAGAETGGNYVPCNGAVWNGNTLVAGDCGEVPMVPAVQGGGTSGSAAVAGYTYPDQLDGRVGGVPDSRAKGPDMWQIGTEGGFLSNAVDLPNGPVGYNYNRRDIVVLNVSNKNLTLGPAERADVVVDFSGATAGDTYILYNDSPAPMPAFDTRYDYFTGDPDQVMTGGAPTTLPGYAPNTRTVMQIQVDASTGPTTTFSALAAALPAAYAATQAAPVVPEPGYDAAFGTSSPPDPYARIQDYKSTFNTGTVTSLTITDPGTGYAGTPDVTIAGGGGAGAVATATIGAQVATLTLTNGGSGFTSSPSVVFTGGGGTGAAATAALTPVAVAGLTLTAGGSGYTAAPTVDLTGGGGTGATATATLAARGIASYAVTASGSGYTSAPTVTLTGGGGSGATATAVLTATKVVKSITINNAGRNYATAPTIAITGGGGSGATATATVSGGRITAITVTNGGSGYTSAPSVAFSGGGGSGATATAIIAGGVASITVNKAGTGYTSAPTVGFTGGGGTGAAATATLAPAAVASLTLTAPGTNYTSAPTVGFTGGGGAGAAATASLAPTSVASLTLTAPGTGYVAAPSVTISGGGGTGATASLTMTPFQVTGLTIANPGSGFVSAPTVTISGGGATTDATATAAITVAPVTVAFQPMGIQELFDPFYGRMNATMSVEIPNTNGTIQTTIPYGYIDPPTDLINTAAAGALGGATPLAMLPDGTQIWRFTHNGVDTHSLHFHMFNLELINRVGWDGAIRPPDANEMGWKETIRMSPLEDAIVAIKPIVPNVPWPLPNSIRPLEVSAPLGDSGVQYTNVDPNGLPVTVTNHLVNFGWEYVFHCHLLGHEENDMMRPMVVGVAPVSPTIQSTTATKVKGKPQVIVTFVDNSPNETGFTVQRSANNGGTWTTVGNVLRAAPTLDTTTLVVNDAGKSVGGILTVTDATVVSGTAYLYRVVANDVIGDTQTPGFPSMSIDSVPSMASSVTP